MDAFYIIVLTVAVILLIGVLAFIGVRMTKGLSNVTIYPPTSLPCPDYWAQNTDSNGNTVCVIPPYIAPGSSSPIPSNTGKIYNSNGVNTLTLTSTPGNTGNAINFTDSMWSTSGKSDVCAKKQWANKYLIQWDGVSNFSNC
jgi:hypothetical protein